MNSFEYDSVHCDDVNGEEREEVPPVDEPSLTAASYPLSCPVRKPSSRQCSLLWLSLGMVLFSAILLALFTESRITTTSDFSNAVGKSEDTAPTHTVAPTHTTITKTDPTSDNFDKSPTTASTTDCEAHYNCFTDRLGHNSHLFRGEAICNRNYLFGMSQDGLFHLRDCATNTVHAFWNKSRSSFYFVMMPNASWHLYDNATGALVWKKDSLRTDIQVHRRCLSRPLLDCPYLHLRKGGGIVLNWIDAVNHKWMARNVRRVYSNLFS